MQNFVDLSVVVGVFHPLHLDAEPELGEYAVVGAELGLVVDVDVLIGKYLLFKVELFVATGLLMFQD